MPPSNMVVPQKPWTGPNEILSWHNRKFSDKFKRALNIMMIANILSLAMNLTASAVGIAYYNGLGGSNGAGICALEQAINIGFCMLFWLCHCGDSE